MDEENYSPSHAHSMDEENYSPSEVANVPAYYALNPSLFDSAEHWTYRDLQKLAKTLGVHAAGRREDLVERLNAWHREQRARVPPPPARRRAPPGPSPISPPA